MSSTNRCSNKMPIDLTLFERDVFKLDLSIQVVLLIEAYIG